MDSRLRGNDIEVTRRLGVIPAQAGIHAFSRLAEGIRPRTWLSRKM
jgi:hypothetical protein